MHFETYLDPEKSEPEDSEPAKPAPRPPKTRLPMTPHLQMHIDVLDQLENKWAEVEPQIGGPYLDGEAIGNVAAIRLSTKLEADIIRTCRSTGVSPANLLSIGHRGTVGGASIEHDRRLRHFCGRNPLLVATIDRVCERVLGPDARRRLIDDLRQRERVLARDEHLVDTERASALRAMLLERAVSRSTCQVIAREALGTLGEPRPPKRTDPPLTRVLASALMEPHAMQRITDDFILDSMRLSALPLTDEQREELAEAMSKGKDMKECDQLRKKWLNALRDNQHERRRPLVVKRASSVLCARFSEDVAALQLLARRLTSQVKDAGGKLQDLKRTGGPGAANAIGALWKKYERLWIAETAATDALSYLDTHAPIERRE